MTKLTAVIPIQAQDFSLYRSRLLLRDSYDLTDVESLIIDYGCPENVAVEIKDFCLERNYTYCRTDPNPTEFSLAKSRNVGIKKARSDWLIMEDVDVVYEKHFYQKLIPELEHLADTPFDFLTIPVAYLKAHISSKILDHGKINGLVTQLVSALLLEDPIREDRNEMIQHYAPATAIIAMRRKMFFMAGLYDESFSSWGGEDRDLIFKLLTLNNKIKKPKYFRETSHVNLNENYAYHGWRSLYALIGDFSRSKGLYGFHLYHDALPWKKDDKNIYEAAKKAQALKQVYPAADEARKIDYIIDESAFASNSQVYEVLNNPCVVSIDIKCSPDAFIESFTMENAASVLICSHTLTEPKKRWLNEVSELMRGLDVPMIEATVCEATKEVIFLDKSNNTVSNPSTYEIYEKKIRYKTLYIPSFSGKVFLPEISLSNTILFDRFKYEANLSRANDTFFKRSMNFVLDTITPHGIYRCDGCSSVEAFARFFVQRFSRVAKLLRPLWRFYKSQVDKS